MAQSRLYRKSLNFPQFSSFVNLRELSMSANSASSQANTVRCVVGQSYAMFCMKSLRLTNSFPANKKRHILRHRCQSDGINTFETFHSAKDALCNPLHRGHLATFLNKNTLCGRSGLNTHSY